MNKIVRYEKTILAEAEDDSPRAKTTSLKKSLFHRDSLLARQRENVLQSVEHHTLNPSSFRRNLSQNDPFDKSKTLDLLFVPDKKPVQIPSKMAKLEFSSSEDSGTIKAGTPGEVTPSRGILKKASTFNSPKHKNSRKSLTLSQVIQVHSGEKPVKSLAEGSKARVKKRPPNLAINSKAKAKESTEEAPSPFLFEKSKEETKISKEPKSRIYHILSKFGKPKAKNQVSKMTGDLSKDQHAMLRDNATFAVKPASLNTAQKNRGDSYQFLWKYQSRGPGSREVTLTQKLRALLTTNPVAKMRSLKKRLEKNLKGPYTPDSKGCLLWEFMITLMILSEFITIPLTLAFDLDQIFALSILNILEDIFFSFDMIIRFNTGFYNKGILIFDRKRIARRYLKLWFWIDFLITFPFELVVPNEDRGFNSSASISNGFSTATLVVRLLKILRVIRVFRLASIFTKFESYLAVSPAVTSLINFMRLLLINLIIAHWIACLWHFTALLEVGKARSTWLTSYGIIDRDWKVRYVFSLYWATTTMITVGYGDITPVTTTEKVLAMITMVVAGGVFANTMNSINEILAGLDNTTQLFSQAMRAIRKYMVKKNIPRELQVKIKKYLEYALNEETSLSIGEKSIYSMLSESLKNELIFEVQGKMLFQAKVLRRVFSIDFLKATTLLMKEKLYSPEDHICLEDNIEDLGIFFISTGKVELFSLYSNSHVNDLDRGAYFGEISFFSGQPRAASARAVDFTSVYYIERNEFLNFIQKFPLEKEKFCTIKDMVNVYGNLARLSIDCFSCNERGHTARNCPLLHYVVKKEDFMNELLARRKEKAKSFQRRPRNEVLDVSRYIKMEDAAIKLMRQNSEKYENKSEVLSSITPGYFPLYLNQSGKSQAKMEAFGLQSEAEESESHNIFGSRQSISPSIILPPMDSIDITKTPLIKEPSLKKTGLRISIVKPDEDTESQDSKRADYDYFSEEDESKKRKNKGKYSKGKPQTLSSNQLSRVISRRSLWSQVREMREQSIYQENILKMDRNIHFETDIDMVANFEYYFPHNNISKLYEGSHYNPNTYQSEHEEKQENEVI